MAKSDVLIEFTSGSVDFDECSEALRHETSRDELSRKLAKSMDAVGFEFFEETPPVPLFDTAPNRAAFSNTKRATRVPNRGSMVLPAKIDSDKWEKVKSKRGVREVWPCSKMTYFGKRCNCDHDDDDFSGPSAQFAGQSPHFAGVSPHFAGVSPHFAGVSPHFPGMSPHVFDLATSDSNTTDCQPFRPGVPIEVIRALLGVERVWFEGFRGQNVVVAILDEGVNGDVYPVIGGFEHPNGPRPGSASIQSHGSMCAADVLVAAPHATLMDYPFLGVPNSGGAMAMFQAVLDQRRENGTPHLTNNSYGFTGISPHPNHEINNPNHPVHRKVREVVASGAPCFFSAGNCGDPCPSGKCKSSGIGEGRSIHAANALDEVITIAAVNSRHERIGCSSQGPSHAHDQGFAKCKPDIAAYSHFFGNFGPGRPAGTVSQIFDNGTSAACPVAAGVGALLLSAFPHLTPEQLKGAMMQTAANIGPPGFDFDTGHGVINAATAFRLIEWTDEDDLEMETDC